jgi:hypothetical protein
VRPNLPDAPSGVAAVEPVVVLDLTTISDAGLPSGWVTPGKGGYAVNDARARERAERLWSDVTATESLPVFSASAGIDGDIAAVGFDMKGASLLADRPEDVKVIKVLPEGDPLRFRHGGADLANYADGTYRVLRGGELYTGAIAADDDYTLVLLIRDGGPYDLDSNPGGVLDPAVIVGAASDTGGSPEEDPGDDTDDDGAGGGANASSGGGGCDAGAFGGLALSMVILLNLRKGRASKTAAYETRVSAKRR